jgi:hypothetical protein
VSKQSRESGQESQSGLYKADTVSAVSFSVPQAEMFAGKLELSLKYSRFYVPWSCLIQQLLSPSKPIVIGPCLQEPSSWLTPPVLFSITDIMLTSGL